MTSTKQPPPPNPLPFSPYHVSHHSENFLEVAGEAGSFIKSLRHTQNFEKTFSIENAELGELGEQAPTPKLEEKKGK